MKEKVKEFLKYFLIIYGVFIIVGSVISLIKYPTKIELHDSDDNLLKYYELKDKASSLLKNNDCHNAIKNVMDYYEETSYNGDVKIVNIYSKDNKTPLGVGIGLVDSCPNYKEKFAEKNILGKILASAMLIEELYYKSNIFKYEINLEDIFMREIYQGNMSSTEYNSERKLQLEIIEELLEIVREDK